MFGAIVHKWEGLLKFIFSGDTNNCGVKCLLAWKFTQWTFAKTLYSYTFISLLNTFSESNESLKNWGDSLEANFQAIEAKKLLVNYGIWLILLYVKFMLQIKIILISFSKCMLQSMIRVPEKTSNFILLLFWQLSPISHIGSSHIWREATLVLPEKEARHLGSKFVCFIHQKLSSILPPLLCFP